MVGTAGSLHDGQLGVEVRESWYGEQRNKVKGGAMRLALDRAASGLQQCISDMLMNSDSCSKSKIRGL